MKIFLQNNIYILEASSASHVVLCTAKFLNKKKKILPFINYTQPRRFAKKKLCQCLFVTDKDLHNVLELLFVLALN